MVAVRGVGGMADDWQCGWVVVSVLCNPGAAKVPGCIVGGRGPETCSVWAVESEANCVEVPLYLDYDSLLECLCRGSERESEVWSSSL